MAVLVSPIKVRVLYSHVFATDTVYALRISLVPAAENNCKPYVPVKLAFTQKETVILLADEEPNAKCCKFCPSMRCRRPTFSPAVRVSVVVT